MYANLYALIAEHIYGLGTTVDALSADMELVCTLVATAGSLFLVSLPFCVVWRMIRGWF